MSFPGYSSYKDSGVEWLGDVPDHWEIKNIRHFAQVLRGKFTHRPRSDPAYYDGEFPFVQTGDITASSRYITEYKQTLNERGIAVSKEFPKGTLVMAIAANIGDVAILDFPAYFPDSIVGLVPKKGVDLMFLYFLMIGMKQPMLMTATISTQMNLNVDQICSLSAGCPPPSEQTAIAEFLDRETAKIDALVTEQQRLMELLKEKRQAVISHAVTRGLNPAAPLKPSGIEWLGDVPAHWEISSFRHSVISIFNGLTADQIDENESTVPVTRIETISAGIIDGTRLGYIAKEDARADRRLEPGDILFSNINSLDMIGNCAFYSGGRVIYAGMNLLVFRPETQRDPKWLYWLVRSSVFREVVESLAKPAINQASISQTSLYGIVIPVPAAEEQVEIARYLDAETAKFDTLTAEAQRAIDLLQERRSALISAAVTGQIDVRPLLAKEAA